MNKVGINFTRYGNFLVLKRLHFKVYFGFGFGTGFVSLGFEKIRIRISKIIEKMDALVRTQMAYV